MRLTAAVAAALVAVPVLGLTPAMAVEATPGATPSGAPASDARATTAPAPNAAGTGTPDIEPATPIAAPLAEPGAAAAPAAPAPAADGALDLTLLATTDVHGHVLNWDYFTNAPYPAGKELGLARALTLIDQVRTAKGTDRVVTLDNGDNIQGTPLTSYYGSTAPITKTGAEHPMAKANNVIGYDAQVVGNHEFNYGLPLLKQFTSQLDYPMLAANVIDDTTGKPIFAPYTIVKRTIDGHPIEIGVIGVTTPGSRVWDKQNLEGKVHFDAPETTVAKYVPEVKAAGADVIVVLSHSGQDPKNQPDDPAALYENVSTDVAMVPGVDVVVFGHTHQNVPNLVITRPDGTKAVMTQPNYWARSVSEVDLKLVPAAAGEYRVDWSDTNAPKASALVTQDRVVGDTRVTVAEDPRLAEAIKAEHQTTVDYVNRVIGRATETMSGATSRYEDTPILDLIQMVEQKTVRDALQGTQYASLPVISQASPFSRDAIFTKGDVTIRDMAGLYIYDNTLSAVKITGKQLKAYLEYSARYFKQTDEGAAFDPETGTNAMDEASGREIPDYNYDALAGVSYDINVSKPVGERIEHLRMPDGTPVADDVEFAMAINNYRQSGGGGFPVAGLPEIYNRQIEIRQALIDWTIEHGVIDPADFFEANWFLVTKTRDLGTEATPAPGDTETPTPAPGGVAGPGLAETGSDASTLLVAALVLATLGGAAIVGSRRRARD